MSSFQQKNHKAYKKRGKYGPFKEKKNKSIETVPKKDLIADILDKDFITTVL